MQYMSSDPGKPVPFSIRMHPGLLARLTARTRRGQSRSALVEELLDEGLRMRDHPGIVFRDGPAGRRAALAGGPDVWEVIETVKGTGRHGEEAIAAAAEWGRLSAGQLRTAIRYYGDYQAEIDEWIDANRAEATRAREAWERAQEALA
jgi:uncharacterized protein (DUF433 family)